MSINSCRARILPKEIHKHTQVCDATTHTRLLLDFFKNDAVFVVVLFKVTLFSSGPPHCAANNICSFITHKTGCVCVQYAPKKKHMQYAPLGSSAYKNVLDNISLNF